jgi:spore coat protein U-like protein
MLSNKWQNVMAVWVAALAVMLNAPANPEAAQSSDGFSVTLTRPTGCTIFATDVDFGAVNSVTNGLTATAQVIGRCTVGTFMMVSFNGAGFFAGTTTGSMAGAIAGNTDVIPYQLQLSGCCAIGQGLNVPITGTITGTVTANVNARPDTYKQTRTIYMYF